MAAPAAWQEAAGRLTAALHLNVAPIAITFSETDGGAPPFVDPAAPMPEPTPDGRTGRVPAGCVYWVHALDRTFTTQPDESAAAVDATVARDAAGDAERFAVLS